MRGIRRFKCIKSYFPGEYLTQGNIYIMEGGEFTFDNGQAVSQLGFLSSWGNLNEFSFSYYLVEIEEEAEIDATPELSKQEKFFTSHGRSIYRIINFMIGLIFLKLAFPDPITDVWQFLLEFLAVVSFLSVIILQCELYHFLRENKIVD